MRPVVMHSFRAARPRPTFVGTVLRLLIVLVVIQVGVSVVVKVLGP